MAHLSHLFKEVRKCLDTSTDSPFPFSPSSINHAVNMEKVLKTVLKRETDILWKEEGDAGEQQLFIFLSSDHGHLICNDPLDAQREITFWYPIDNLNRRFKTRIK
ncbi:hypothetical protein OUZ56_015807 [Daphnia magna]|uniref:Uncharacterized protein n=1 Tax=Daphnia magna TaxID=35525 RepID=A0ABR0ANT2_9CRUS|nr:hypothetical protein OUZ56_015807 [Daphnia magna]